MLANIETLPRDAQSVMGRRKASVMRVKQATGNELAQMGNNSRSKSYLPLYISVCQRKDHQTRCSKHSVGTSCILRTLFQL